MPRTSSLLGRAGPLIAARLVSAVVTLAIPLVLARVMPIAEYGTYKQLFLISFTASHVLPFGVSQSLYFFVPRTQSPRAWFGQTLAFLAAAGALGGGVLWLAGPWLASALTNPGLAAHRAELALYTALFVAASPLEISMTSRGRTRLSAASYLVCDATRAALLSLPAAAGLGLHAMMQGMIVFAALRCAAAWVLMVGLERGRLFDRALFRAQLAYAVPFGVAILFSIPQQYAHQFIVAHAVGPALFAIYAAGCFQLPFIELFYTPTSEVLMVQLGELERAGRRAESAAAFRDAVERLATLLLPPIFFIAAVAPTFVVTAFGQRFAAATPIFQITLLAAPLGIWPVDATLRARGQTPHILHSYMLKAAVTIPVVWICVQRFGLLGAAGSFVATEYLGRFFLAWKLPAALSSQGQRARVADLVPVRQLARTAAVSCALAALGAGALRVASGAYAEGGGTFLHRAIPLAFASAAFGVGYLATIALSGTQVPGALGAVVARMRGKRAAAA
jgi:O-antigen/teichoic acid export membrane protein